MQWHESPLSRGSNSTAQRAILRSWMHGRRRIWRLPMDLHYWASSRRLVLPRYLWFTINAMAKNGAELQFSHVGIYPFVDRTDRCGAKGHVGGVGGGFPSSLYQGLVCLSSCLNYTQRADRKARQAHYDADSLMLPMLASPVP